MKKSINSYLTHSEDKHREEQYKMVDSENSVISFLFRRGQLYRLANTEISPPYLRYIPNFYFE